MNKMIGNFNQGVDFQDLYQKDVALKFCVLTALKDGVGQDYRLSRENLIAKVGLIWYWNVSYPEDKKTHKPPSERKIRNCIRDLRKAGALIISTGGSKGGYWKAESLEEVKAFVEAEYRSRAFDMLETASRMHSAALKWFGGQQLLPGQFYCEGCGNPTNYSDMTNQGKLCITCVKKSAGNQAEQ